MSYAPCNHPLLALDSTRRSRRSHEPARWAEVCRLASGNARLDPVHKAAISSGLKNGRSASYDYALPRPHLTPVNCAGS